MCHLLAKFGDGPARFAVAGASEDVQPEIRGPFDPLVVLLSQHRPTRPDQCSPVREHPTASVRCWISLFSRSCGLLDQICSWNAVNADRSARAASRCSVTVGSFDSSVVVLRVKQRASGCKRNATGSQPGHDDFGVTAIPPGATCREVPRLVK